MRFFAVKTLPLFLTMSLVVLNSTTADAACSCKSGRWVTLGVSTAGYDAAACSRTFQEAKQFDDARAMSFNPQKMQCSLCFGSNWRCSRKTTERKSKPPMFRPKPANLEMADTSLSPTFRPNILNDLNAADASEELCERQRQLNIKLGAACLKAKQKVNQAGKSDPDFSTYRNLTHAWLVSKS